MSDTNEKTIERVGDKYYNSMKEFYDSPDFKVFEKNSLAKIVEIAKKLKLYPQPNIADFAGAYSLNERSDGLKFCSVDLADKLNFKLVPYIWLDNFGAAEFIDQEVKPKNTKNKKDASQKTVQLICFNFHWRYQHYSAGGNGTELFTAYFDVKGKLAHIRAVVKPKELEELKNKSDTWRRFDDEEKRSAAEFRPEYEKKQKIYEAKIKKLYDKDNMLAQAEKTDSRER